MDQLRSLRVFVRVVADGSLAGASRSLDLAPAVVTRALAELEQYLGARLLNRSTRRLALTPIGEAYLQRAQQILAELEDADALAGAATRQPRGLLRVLCPPAFAVHQLARHLPRFRATHPHIDLDITAPGAVEAADPHHDVSIVSVGQQPLEGDFIVRRLASSTFVLCAAPGYLNRSGRPTEPDELMQHEAVLPAVSAVRREITLYRDDDAAATGKPGAARVVTLQTPPAALSSAQLELLLAAAVAGLGIAGLPSFMLDDALRDGRLERVLPSWRGTTVTLYAALPTRQHLPARTRAFVDFLVLTFGGEASDPWLAAIGKP